MFLVLLIVFILALNFWGVSIKISEGYQYAAVVLPYDFSVNAFRSVSITVYSLNGEKKSWKLPVQRREHFRACYWGDDENLWIDGQYGISVNRLEVGEWVEFPIIGSNNEGMLFIDCSGVQESISREEIPIEILKRIE